MTPYSLRIIEIIQGIPEGYIMTYGQIAELAGNRRGARQVVRILHSMSRKHKLPWHRVVNARGEIALKDEESRFVQIMKLESEGIPIENGRIDLDKKQFYPQY